VSDKYILVHEGLSRWINAPNNGGECCATWADTVDELNRLNDHIKRLEEFVEQLTNPKFTRDDLPNEALLQHIKRLEEAGDALEKWLDRNTPATVRHDWRAAREEKP
jgi:uncharacterized protein with HEPN domain